MEPNNSGVDKYLPDTKSGRYIKKILTIKINIYEEKQNEEIL